MNSQHSTWAVVLAAGDGKRLHSLTYDATGRPVPKQYCSLSDGPTLLQDALRRGRQLAGRNRLCAIVAEQHIEWWPHALRSLQLHNVFVQPANRGTGVGILLPLLSIVAREPSARVTFFPADHFVANENVLATGIGKGLRALDYSPDEIMLLGIEPHDADAELGYILPSSAGGAVRRVVCFVEKPSLGMAGLLVGAGALWNSFIFSASASALLELFRERIPSVVAALEAVLADPRPAALDELYARLPEVDFSRDILGSSVRRLRVVAVADCGWTDLGTPRRVGDLIRQGTPRAMGMRSLRRGASTAPVNLTTAFFRSIHVGSAADHGRGARSQQAAVAL